MKQHIFLTTGSELAQSCVICMQNRTHNVFVVNQAIKPAEVRIDGMASERTKLPKQRTLDQPKSSVQYWPALAHFLFFSRLSRGRVRGQRRGPRVQRRKCAHVLAAATDR